ncbi:hypothetical protein ACFL5O_09380, partial [Myxococcota bacterium]
MKDIEPPTGQKFGIGTVPHSGHQKGTGMRCNEAKTGLQALAIFLLGACGSEDEKKAGCTPGQMIACYCTDGRTGAQRCSSEGAFGDCNCTGADARSDTSLSRDTQGKGEDSAGRAAAQQAEATVLRGAGGKDENSAGRTAAQQTGGHAGQFGQEGVADTEHSVTGSAGAAGTAGGCSPQDMSDWVPPSNRSARRLVSACTIEQIDRYASACWGSTRDCSSFESGGADEECGRCLRPTPYEDASWGLLVSSGQLNATNLAGCIEILGDTDCAARNLAAFTCKQEACADSCVNVPAASWYEALSTCKEEAELSVCAKYAADTACVTGVEGVDLRLCSGGTFVEMIAALGRVFCGP